MFTASASQTNTAPQTGSEFALHCRGDVRLYCGEVDCTPKSKKGRALLAILAAEQRPLSRVKIIDLLWSDRQEEQARASLRTLLSDLKEQFNSRFEDLLVVDRERVALGPLVHTDLTDPALARPSGELFEGLDHIDPELDEWLRLEREKWAKELATGTPLTPASAPQRHAVPQWAIGLALLVALIAAALLYFRPWAAPEQPVVAVLKFKDLTGKNALLADGLAEELRIQLAHHPVQVIGRESSESDTLQIENAVQTAHRRLGATHAVEGAVINRDGSPHLSVRLTDASTGKQLWSQVVAGEGAMIRSGSAAIAGHVAGNVNETIGQGSGIAFRASASAYEEVFAARRAIRSFDPADALRSRAALQEVVSQHPRFAPALATLAEATMYASEHPWFRGPLPLRQARREAEHYARRAIAAAPSFGPAYTALGVAYHETPAALEPLRRAVQLSPGSFEARHRFARALDNAGEFEAGLIHQRTAAKLEPLDDRAHSMLVLMLWKSGRREEMTDVVRDFVQRTDDVRKKLLLISVYSDIVGDFSTTYLAERERIRLEPNNEQARRGMMWAKINTGDRAGALAYARPDSVTAMILKEDLLALVRKVTALGADFWSVESIDPAHYLVRHGRSDLLVRLYDQARAATAGKQPDLSVIDGALIVALRDTGRTSDANRLLGEYAAGIDRRWPSAGQAAWPRAEVLVFRGRYEEALDQLELAQRDHWRNLLGLIVPFEQQVVFDPIRNHPRFRAIVRSQHANIEREKRELAAELRRYGNGPIDPERLILAGS